MLAIGMALLCRPKLLLIDELSLGLAPIVIKELMQQLRLICRELGLTVLLVEQNAKAALTIADHGYVMESGRVVFYGPAAELINHPDVREFYLGGAGRVRARRTVISNNIGANDDGGADDARRLRSHAEIRRHYGS